MPHLVDSNVVRGDDNDSDLMFRQSGESDASFGVTSDPELLDSPGRGGREGESADETEPAGILMECAGRLRPRVPPMPRPRCEGLRGKGYRGLSINDEKGLGTVLRLSFTLPACDLCHEFFDSSILPMLTMACGEEKDDFLCASLLWAIIMEDSLDPSITTTVIGGR